jgi:hypothetical protein
LGFKDGSLMQADRASLDVNVQEDGTGGFQTSFDAEMRRHQAKHIDEDIIEEVMALPKCVVGVCGVSLIELFPLQVSESAAEDGGDGGGGC